MASRTDGIQLLLQAEKSASDKVNEAKRRKAKRLKQAKVEAQAEIDAERSERERHFKMCEERVSGKMLGELLTKFFSGFKYSSFFQIAARFSSGNITVHSPILFHPLTLDGVLSPKTWHCGYNRLISLEPFIRT
ncbi:hypothetical protein PHET_10983 [Paragonimus heterotremus]|uniref:V-type proton ATPase subunit G n=1 Tax=Paragonimus heterotremus TaxID=100268 RepID=A0A8J4SU32_9TREM|nr:hypothetical protein PHET_10983 [Paragonimus heterotremus]